jgi:sugar porter (SP) family MFS transporter
LRSVEAISAECAPVIRVEWNRTYVWTISLVAALGGLLFGYDWVVIGGAKPFYEKFFGLTEPAQQGWAVSCALVGCLLGTVLSGSLSDRYGRKRLLVMAALLFGTTSLGTAMASSFNVFVTWRILGGVAIGLASNLSPMYIAEVAPSGARGRLVSLNQLTIVVGILLAQIVNWLIARPVSPEATAFEILNSWNGQTGWRCMFGATAVPSFLFLIGMLFVPESPRWLAREGKRERAQAILARIGGAAYASEALEAIESTLQRDQKPVSFRKLVDFRVVKILLLGIALAVYQQWSGINVIFNYAEEIFSAAGYKVSDILLNIVVTGVVNLLFTLVAIATVDRIGRRTLMLIGSAGLAIIYVLLGACYQTRSHGLHVLILVVMAIACFAMSLGPVVWVVIAEIFPNRIRGAAMSIAVSSLWIACFVLTYTFPLLNRALGPAGSFWIYAGICAVGFVFVLFRLPETKGKTLEQIEVKLMK